MTDIVDDDSVKVLEGRNGRGQVDVLREWIRGKV